jgi:hypothetical protein
MSVLEPMRTLAVTKPDCAGVIRIQIRPNGSFAFQDAHGHTVSVYSNEAFARLIERLDALGR